jgi:hypothetical protein
LEESPPCRITASGTCDEHGASVYLGVSRRTLRRWRKDERGPAHLVVGGRVWYMLADLDAFLDLCRHDPMADQRAA